MKENEPLNELKEKVTTFTKSTPVVVALRKLQKVVQYKTAYMKMVADVINNQQIRTKLDTFTLDELIKM